MSDLVERLKEDHKEVCDSLYGLLYALRDLPEMPSTSVLLTLNTAAKWPDDHNAGIMAQRTYGLAVIPPKCECECGAGVWLRLKRGLGAASRITALEEENKRLRDALEPFSKTAEWYTDDEPDWLIITDIMPPLDGEGITVGDLRRARKEIGE